MRKLIVTAWIFSLTLFVFPLMLLGNGVSERSEVENDPLFATYEDLEAELPILGMVSVEETILDIVWTGKQNKVVNPSGNHNHHAKVESASGFVTLLGVSSDLGAIPVIVIAIEIESGEMNEHGVGEETDKTTVDVFLRTKSAVMDIVFPPILPEPIDLGTIMVKIKDGQIQFQKIGAFPAPGKG